MTDYKLISSDNELIEFRKYLMLNDIFTIAIDFESENNLHEYGSRLCLIQIFDGKCYFLVDPFKISKEELKKTLEDKKIIKLVYGTESDMSLLFKQYEIRMKAVYDLKILVDVLEVEKRGLGEVIKLFLGIESENKKKFQMHNWTRRPIDEQAIEYALSDVAYLFTLKTLLLEKIISTNCVDMLIEQLVKREYDYEKTSIPGFFKSREFGDLRAAQKVLAKQIFQIRDQYAQEQNCPPNDMLSNKDILRVAQNTGLLKSIDASRRIDSIRFEKMKLEIEQMFERK